MIKAEITGSTTARARGITAHATAPVLELCRQLVAAAHDPATPLEAYRGEMLCLRVRSIGEAAELELAGGGKGFRRRENVGAGPLVSANEKSEPRPAGQRADESAAL